jgi:hypothetical protein
MSPELANPDDSIIAHDRPARQHRKRTPPPATRIPLTAIR